MRRLALAAAAALFAAAPPAAAQLIVHDPTSYASLLREARTALDQLAELRAQLDEARRLYDGFNAATGAGGLAAGLAAEPLRRLLPELDAYAAAAGGDLAALGELGETARRIREDLRRYAAPADDVRGQDLERRGDRAARDAALGLSVARAGATRLSGLRDLVGALDAAPSVRGVLDLQARLAAEQALGANDRLRLQGLAMAQAAEDRLAEQQAREAAAAAVRARLAHHRRGFP